MKNTVMIVDDSEIFQHLMKKIVESLGYKTIICGDGDELLKFIRLNPDLPAAVFLDIYMPQVDGMSTLGQIRANHPDLPVVVITASEDAEDKKAVISLGVSGFINKMQGADELHHAVKKILDKGARAS